MNSERQDPRIFVIDIGKGGAPCWRYVAAYNRTAVATAYGINLFIAEERTIELAYWPREIDRNLCDHHSMPELARYFKSKQKKGKTYVDEGHED